MGIVLGWLVFAIVVGVAASGRGRSGLAWFLLSVAFSPLLMAVLLALLPSLVSGRSAEELAAADARERVKCPECAELILREAKVCKHCGARVQWPEEPPVSNGLQAAAQDGQNESVAQPDEPGHQKIVMLILLALGISWLVIIIASRVG